MNSPRQLLAAAAISAVSASPALAGTWTHMNTLPALAASPISIAGHSVTFSSSPADVWWYDDNITPQSAASLLTTVATQYGVAPATLHYVGGCDDVGVGCSGPSGTTLGGDGTGTNTNTFTDASAFTYLAVHFGKGELLFHWTAPHTTFSISGLPRGLSNYRAYAPVPEPETYAMFLAGLGMMGAVARRRAKRT